jgi:predicted AlkP superfamily pyrophosphatase or phosphodiesterase
MKYWVLKPLTAAGVGVLVATFSVMLTGPVTMIAAPPKLVVVVVIDQFPQVFLDRFSEHFVDGGFNLFLRRGAVFSDARMRHATSSTGSGHAVVLSGSYASENGIIGNDWLDRETYEGIYCASDPGSLSLGGDGAAGRSPRLFLATTVGDQWKTFRSPHSRVIAISDKDRAAVMLGGKLADAAYWSVNGRFVTSDYYLYELPRWVEDFNDSGRVESYFGKVWDRLLPEDAYATQGVDDFLGESPGNGLGRTFPRTINGGGDEISVDFYHAFYASPFCNEVLAEFAKEAIVREALGQREVTDILAISFSGNDKVGHSFGPDSHEVMDVTLRTDRILADLFGFIDDRVGLEHATIVLTADHGVMPIPEKILLARDRLPAGRVEIGDLLQAVERDLDDRFGPLENGGRWLAAVPGNVYLRESALGSKGLARIDIEDVVKSSLLKRPEVQAAFTRTQLVHGKAGGLLGPYVANSFYEGRSGDVVFVLKAFHFLNYHPGSRTGTDHGSPYSYDTHVPLLWFGVGVEPGVYTRPVGVEDLAPTLTRILGVTPPVLSRGRDLFPAVR